MAAVVVGEMMVEPSLEPEARGGGGGAGSEQAEHGPPAGLADKIERTLRVNAARLERLRAD